MDLSWDRWVNFGASAGMTAAAVGFVVAYQLLAPWRSSVAGRHMMGMAAALAALGAYTVAVSVWPESSALRLLRAGIVTVVGVLLVQRTVMLVRAQRSRRPG